MPESEWEARARQIRDEMKNVSELADALERILPSIADDETKRKVEQEIQSYRLEANRLSEHIRDPNAK